MAAETNDSLRSQGRRQKSAYSPSKTIFISNFNVFALAFAAAHQGDGDKWFDLK